jgi:hypothetical protein
MLNFDLKLSTHKYLGSNFDLFCSEVTEEEVSHRVRFILGVGQASWEGVPPLYYAENPRPVVSYLSFPRPHFLDG